MARASVHAAGPDVDPVALAGLKGGLIVQLGTSDLETPIILSRTGRYLVEVLATSAKTLDKARSRCRAEGHYGLVSVELTDKPGRLPYADNLVNLVIVDTPLASATELFRVVTPNGAVVVRNAGAVSAPALRAAGFKVSTTAAPPLFARKPRPKQMDDWSHPRHDAGGNAVSGDTLVGPPKQVRWIAGALSEVEGLVTAGGRNFYGGILVRDSFNGLRLWHRDLRRGKLNGAAFRLTRPAWNLSRPVAAEAVVFVAEGNRLKALDAADGRVVRVFPGVSRPTEVVHNGRSVIACDDSGVHAYRFDTGELLWMHAAPGARNLAADRRIVSFLAGRPRRGEKVEAVVVDIASGKVRWRRSDYAWLKRVSRVVLKDAYIAYEVSTIDDNDAGNSLHVVSSATGRVLWEKAFPPGMNHNRQARAMFAGTDLWVLHGGKTNTADPDHIKRLPTQVSALNPRTGEVRTTFPAGLAHCFPPVATQRFLFSGVMDLTDLQTGKMFVNPITKANCSRESGWVPANGLIYTTPKHCTCWPILRGFVALAPERDTDRAATGNPPGNPQLGPGEASRDAPDPTPSDWPLYRHDAWRSAGTPEPGPRRLNTLWSVSLAHKARELDGPIPQDWRENAFVKGPVSAPTVAYGRVYVARPDAHEVVALDAETGAVSWRFTADGRVDTPPALALGLCLFGSRAGSVYALRADSGKVVWRLRAAPTDKRIVTYGQIESPWPVPGAVLVGNGVAYFAAGRQPLADGGIRVFAVDPVSGRRRWVRRINTIPQRGYYENSGLEFDSFDILHREGDGIAMSRWIISADGKKVTVDKWAGFARLDSGGGAVWVPRECWSYGPRHQHRFGGEAPRRPLWAFHARTVLSSLNGTTEIFRRDFDLEHGEKFNSHWITGWEAAQTARKGGRPFRTDRLAKKANWKTDPFTPAAAKKRSRPPGTQLHNDLYAMALAGDGRLFVIHKDGRLKVLAVANGAVRDEARVPPPAWDALAIANRRLYLTTQEGRVLCIGD
ncbi:MAG: PQQ-binding-like beta-propeller repeat protein [Kiritimatiellaeota bacterium]|nr:PQQ-binding-like beta-propeller repeat protein [Kiritimatiellota bacterium]